MPNQQDNKNADMLMISYKRESHTNRDEHPTAILLANAYVNAWYIHIELKPHTHTHTDTETPTCETVTTASYNWLY
jgi:hypothetical protein